MPRNPLRMLTLPLALMTGACTTTYTNRNPVGEPFPVMTGTSLEKEEVTLPTAFEGDPALYMVSYVQETQFDLDRWAIGLTQMKFPCRIMRLFPRSLSRLSRRWQPMMPLKCSEFPMFWCEESAGP